MLTRLLITIVAATGVLACPSLAQHAEPEPEAAAPIAPAGAVEPEVEPEAEPEPTAEPELGMDPLETPAQSGRVFRAAGTGPGDSSIPGIVLPDYRPSRGSLYPEGAYLLRRRGIVVPLGDDRWAFVFDADAQGEKDPPMHLMPGLRLSEMVRLVQSRPDTITFLLDGEVFVYHDRNFLLPIDYEIASGTQRTSADEVDATLEANRALRSADDKDASVESLMERLERASASEEPRSTVSGPAPGVERENPNLLPEQTVIVSRRGRLARTERAWSFSHDNDTDATDADRPATAAFLLMPCLNSQEMERLAEARGDRIVFLVSGAVYVFEGRNYLLPTMYVVEHDRDGNLNPAQ